MHADLAKVIEERLQTEPDGEWAAGVRQAMKFCYEEAMACDVACHEDFVRMVPSAFPDGVS